MKIKASPVMSELRRFTPAYVTLFIFSLFGPIMYMVSPLFMQQISDRVVLSRNESTLVVLTVFAMAVMVIYAGLDYLRSRTLQRIGVALDARLTAVVFDALHRQRSNTTGTASAQPLIDINSVRDFMAGPMVGAAFDAFWSPLFIVVMFIIHPVFGYLSLAMIVLSVGLTLLNQFLVSESSRSAAQCSSRANDFGNAIFRNTEPVVALGMLPRVKLVWYRMHHAALGWQSVASNRSFVIQSMNRFMRNSQPIIVYAVGAYLYLRSELGMGAMMVAMIVMMRGLGPIDQVIASWRSYAGFKGAVERLDEVLVKAGQSARTISLPRPTGALDVSRIIGTAPDGEKMIINDVSFSVQPGTVLGIIGPSGAGKSCLARFLVGRWRPRRGQISIGDHEMAHWNEDDLGQYLGYMPQDIEMLPGTVADNIARFDPEVTNDSDKLVTAANLAGINDLIKELPDGFNTRVGHGGHVLSGGQRQRIALARAVYGNPHLVILDEPSSSLDAAGEQALGLALERMKQNGSAVVVITHKLSLLTYCDDVLILNAGTVQAVGPRAQIVERLS
ncbi:MAG: type I secretion system permease/ATPase, partial [Hyphomicrobiaceae bacterium]